MERIQKHLPLKVQVSDTDLVPTQFCLIPSALLRPGQIPYRLGSLEEQQTVDVAQGCAGRKVAGLWPAGTAHTENKLHFHVLSSRPSQGRRQETDPQPYFGGPLDNGDPEVPRIWESALVAIRLKHDKTAFRADNSLDFWIEKKAS